LGTPIWCLHFFYFFLKKCFTFFYFFFTFLVKKVTILGVRKPWKFAKFKTRQISKKKKYTCRIHFSMVKLWWNYGEIMVKWTFQIFRNSWPLFWRISNFFAISTRLFINSFQEKRLKRFCRIQKHQFSFKQTNISCYTLSINFRLIPALVRFHDFHEIWKNQYKNVCD